MPPSDPQPPVQQTVNVGGGGIFDGLTGWIRVAVATSFAGIVAGCFLWLMYLTYGQGRQDRMEDRQLFRESIRDIQHEADRRAGEVKGALDGNSNVVRELIAELKSAKRDGRAVPQSAMPKAPP